MSSTPHPADLRVLQNAETTGGVRVVTAPESSSAAHERKRVNCYDEECRQFYTEDPLNTCLASRLIPGR